MVPRLGLGLELGSSPNHGWRAEEGVETCGATVRGIYSSVEASPRAAMPSRGKAALRLRWHGREEAGTAAARRTCQHRRGGHAPRC